MSILVTLCLLKIEIVDEMENEGESAAASSVDQRVIKERRGQRQPKTIQIETYANVLAGEHQQIKGVLPKNSNTNSREQTPLTENNSETSSVPDTPNEVKFFSGNPFVEQTNGILHLYKKNERDSIQDGLSQTLCLLAVPATLSCHDILNFIAPCHSVINHVRIIRDSNPNQYMVILDFRTVDDAYEFYKTFNGVPYNSLEPEQLCHTLWVSAIAWDNMDSTPPNHTELPVCPVCLDRMDESVDGVLTILCNHTFHCGCLVKWGDSTCPICRYVQTPELTQRCGRYQGGHAAIHYRNTNHTYALQLGTNRVWDYAGDNFVHRLLQNKSDGKLVATQSPSGEGEEKIDSMQLEFTYLLTSQLDTQRQHYEERLARIEAAMVNDKQGILKETEAIKEKNSEFEQKLNAVVKEKQAIEKKLNAMSSRLAIVLKDLSEEKQFSKTLQLNHNSWQTKYSNLEKLYKEKEQEVIDLKEQVRDLMFYMEAQNTISKSELKDEIAEGSVTIGETSGNGKNKNRRKKKSST
ncbi:hypothetical protein PVAND_012078 [Polypedilum vanderplanki]|uniref:BRCA1-associated protein n=1 Tax=Polypedilum vanderplanki TaxID=319348 RepID=A0A9J6CKH8_POLVA|nr:hypothetical protein PVAND_012078 [Polypedilum vanderplanki]